MKKNILIKVSIISSLLMSSLLTNAQNVGVGTTNPLSKFHVRGQLRVDTLLSGSSSDSMITVDANGVLRRRNSNSFLSSNLYTTDGTLTGNRIVTQGTNTLNFTGTGVTTFNSGNVGIGITSPNAPLQFATTVANRKLVLFDGMNNDHQFYGFGVNGGVLRYQLDGTGSSHVFYAGTGTSTSNELFRILGNGNVGIGASAPSAHLTIGRNGNVANGNILLGSSTDASSKWTSIASQQFNVNGSTNNRGYSLITGVSGNANENVVSIGGSLAEQYAATSINFNTATTSTTTGGITRMTITGAGNVGIANAAPSERLDVTGNVRFSGALMPNNVAGTAGQVLSSNGTGNAPTWITPSAVANATTTTLGIVQLAGDLSGTATTPTVATGAITSGKILDGTVANIDLAAGVGGIYKGSGSLSGATTVTQGTNALNFTGTGVTTFNSGNVGIGTVSPNAPLQFANAMANRKLVLWEETNNDHQFYGLGLNSAIFRYQIPSAVTSHVFYAGTGTSTSSELFRIGGNGNVGIANAAPSERLDVTGNVRFSGALMPNNVAGTAGQVLSSNGTGNAPTWITPSAVANATTTTLGIVQLAGDLSGTATTPTVATGAITSGKILDGTVANIDLAAGVGGIYKGSGSLSGATTVTQGTNALNFTGTGVTTFNSGNVGIGTTSPNAPLQFAATVANRKLVLFDGMNNDHEFFGFGVNGGVLRYQLDGTGSSHVFYAGTGTSTSSELFRIGGNGNVGIANATPSERLDVTGNVRFSGALMPNNVAGTAGQVLSSNGTGNAPTWITPSAAANATTTTLGIVQLAGDLSGTATTPTVATGAITSGKILDGTVANIDLAAGVGGIYKGSGSLSGATTVTQGTNALNFTGTGVTTFNSGNVGIGTTSPNAPLQFANTVANRKLVLFDGINNDHQFYGFGVNSVDVNGGIFRYQLDGTGSSHVFYAGTGTSTSNELFRILGNGNVGIGASAPSAHLTIGRNGNVANGNILLGSSTDASSKWTSIASQQFNVNGSINNRGYSLITGVSGNANENVVSIGGGLAEQYSATSINFNTAATSTTTSGITRMTITGAGNVGIGTAAPSNSAILDLSSNTMGIAIPRMTSAQRKAIVSPTTGLQVYDTDLKGIYIFDGTWDCLNVPAGTVQYAARNTPPRGYLEANGQAVDRTTYAELFTAIGTTYGAGNGTTTFNLPDLRGEFVRGWSNGRAGVDAGRAFASSQLDDLKSHLHAVDPPATLSEVSGNHAHTAADGNAFAFTGYTGTGNNGTVQGLPTTGNGFGTNWGQGFTNAAGNHQHFLDIPSFSSSSTGGTETRPRNIALLPIIKF